MNAYSKDLTEKIVAAVLQRGMAKSEAARTFSVSLSSVSLSSVSLSSISLSSVSLSSVKRYVGATSEGRSPAPKKSPGAKPKLDERARRLLAADVQERPFVTLSERRNYLKAVSGVCVSNSTICRELKRMDQSRKKGA